MPLPYYLFLLGLVGGDEALHAFDANLDGTGSILGHLHEQTGLFTLLVPDSVEAAAAADTQSSGHDEQSRAFHFAGLDTQALPAFPLLQQFIVNR